MIALISFIVLETEPEMTQTQTWGSKNGIFNQFWFVSLSCFFQKFEQLLVTKELEGQ